MEQILLPKHLDVDDPEGIEVLSDKEYHTWEEGSFLGEANLSGIPEGVESLIRREMKKKEVEEEGKKKEGLQHFLGIVMQKKLKYLKKDFLALIQRMNRMSQRILLYILDDEKKHMKRQMEEEDVRDLKRIQRELCGQRFQILEREACCVFHPKNLLLLEWNCFDLLAVNMSDGDSTRDASDPCDDGVRREVGGGEGVRFHKKRLLHEEEPLECDYYCETEKMQMVTQVSLDLSSHTWFDTDSLEMISLASYFQDSWIEDLVQLLRKTRDPRRRECK